jgi:hypothetical protein
MPAIDPLSALFPAAHVEGDGPRIVLAAELVALGARLAALTRDPGETLISTSFAPRLYGIAAELVAYGGAIAVEATAVVEGPYSTPEHVDALRRVAELGIIAARQRERAPLTRPPVTRPRSRPV